MDIWIVSFILLVVLVLLITEKITVDITAIGIMVVLMITGLLTPAEAVSGFANPAVITVAAMFILSRGLIRTGAVNFIAARVSDLAGGNRHLALLTVMATVGVASAFINNTPVVVLFIPIIFSITCTYQLSPSKFLIPMSYASILGGMCTLIGTSTNIIVSDLSIMSGLNGLGMFELAPLGVPIALLGLIFIFVASPRLMPQHKAPVCELETEGEKRYLAELRVPPGSEFVGSHPDQAFTGAYASIESIEIVRGSHIMNPARKSIELRENDLILVKGNANDLMALLRSKLVDLPSAEDGISFEFDDLSPHLIELIIPPQSSLVGSRLRSLSLQGDPEIHIIAIKSHGVHYSEKKIQDVRLRVGDMLLVMCPQNRLEGLRSEGGFIILEDVQHQLVDKTKAKRALLVFAGVVVAATTGVASIMMCAISGVFLMAVGRCFRLRFAYRALQPDVLLLIIGTIALGRAMEKTGAASFYADLFMDLFKGLGPRGVLFGILMLTSISTQLLSNNATAVLILPIAISAAATLGVDPRPLIIGVCFGASACFATPIGYQTNLLVYGPGGYRFIDYLKLGIPLNLLVILMGTLFIPAVWPF
jgi:di/tricarboxylate transporter